MLASLLLLWLFSVQSSVLAQQRSGAFSSEEKSALLYQGAHLLGGRRSPVTRWQQGVRYIVAGSDDAQRLAKVERVFNELYWITGIDYTRLDGNYPDIAHYIRVLRDSADFTLTDCRSDSAMQCANFVVVISDQRAIHQISEALPLRSVYQRAAQSGESVNCFFAPGVTPDREIKRGFVYIRDDLDDAMFETCLHEEIFQSFGLFNDQSGSDYFSFNNFNRPKIITLFDKALIASLYHPDFPPGTPAYRVVEHMVERLHQGRFILPGTAGAKRFRRPAGDSPASRN